MWIKGKLSKDGRFWMVEFPELDACTQGHNKAEAYEMAKDLLEGLAEAYGFDLDITVAPVENDIILAGSENKKDFVAFVLHRLRDAAGLTLEDVTQKLGAKSLNAYARYEQGRSEPTVSKIEELVSAITDAPFAFYYGGAAVMKTAELAHSR
ncbi:MAG: helix-turn-helix domain-containing protein [Nitrospinae bacterium]|nr:helix-turn-helix domain-containing protein [Nitrospinota bacterium]